jgi:hypothetical protein
MQTSPLGFGRFGLPELNPERIQTAMSYNHLNLQDRARIYHQKQSDFPKAEVDRAGRRRIPTISTRLSNFIPTLLPNIICDWQVFSDLLELQPIGSHNHALNRVNW